MIIRMLAAGTVLAAATPLHADEAAGTPQASQPDISIEDPDVIQARKDRYERLTVPVMIEGKGPYRFMIDTGSQATAVSRAISEEVGMTHIGRAMLVAMGSRREVDLVELNGLEFAGRLYDNLQAPLLESRNVGADGILGLDSLQDLRVLMNFKEDRMTVADAGSLSSNRGYEIVVKARRRLGQMIITNAKVDGVKTSVIIDTGAQNTVGNRALRNRMRVRPDTIVQSTDVNGVLVTGNLALAKSMSIDGLQLSNVPISFSDSPAFEALGLNDKPAVILGMRNLRSFDRVAIDFASRRVLFDLPSGAYSVNPYERVFFPSRVGGN